MTPGTFEAGVLAELGYMAELLAAHRADIVAMLVAAPTGPPPDTLGRLWANGAIDATIWRLIVRARDGGAA